MKTWSAAHFGMGWIQKPAGFALFSLLSLLPVAKELLRIRSMQQREFLHKAACRKGKDLTPTVVMVGVNHIHLPGCPANLVDVHCLLSPEMYLLHKLHFFWPSRVFCKILSGPVMHLWHRLVIWPICCQCHIITLQHLIFVVCRLGEP